MSAESIVIAKAWRTTGSLHGALFRFASNASYSAEAPGLKCSPSDRIHRRLQSWVDEDVDVGFARLDRLHCRLIIGDPEQLHLL